MFEEYTPEAKRSMLFARGAAFQLGSETIEGVHLLLGLARENIELVNRFLSSSVTESTFQSEITNSASTSSADLEQLFNVPFSSESKRIFSFAAEEATRMSQERVGIEHLFLGLLREENCLAARMLRERGADVVRVRNELAVKPHLPPATQERVLREIEKMRKILADAPVRTPARSRDDVFGRYKGKARLVVFGATHEASRLGSPAVKTEHLLLCVLKTSTVRFRLFLPLADSRESVCKHIEDHVGEGKAVAPSQQTLAPEKLPLSDEYQRVLNYAKEEATLLGSEHTTPEHLLLGMLREEGSYAATVLREYGAELERIRRELAA
jgi:ATP-dependent Clp protease ATP-binding subunit ClpA